MLRNSRQDQSIPICFNTQVGYQQLNQKLQQLSKSLDFQILTAIWERGPTVTTSKSKFQQSNSRPDPWIRKYLNTWVTAKDIQLLTESSKFNHSSYKLNSEAKSSPKIKSWLKSLNSKLERCLCINSLNSSSKTNIKSSLRSLIFQKLIKVARVMRKKTMLVLSRRDSKLWKCRILAK